jgi:hypothetical protein
MYSRRNGLCVNDEKIRKAEGAQLFATIIRRVGNKDLI